MSDNRETVKLIIEIPKPMYECIQKGTYCGNLYEELKNGIPLDDVKAEIDKLMPWIYKSEILGILDNIGKESEVKPNE